MLKYLVILLLVFSPTMVAAQTCWVDVTASCDDLAIKQIGIVGGSCGSKNCIPIGAGFFCPLGVGLDVSIPGNVFQDVKKAGAMVAGFTGTSVLMNPFECGRVHVCQCTGAGACTNSPPGIGGQFKPTETSTNPNSTPCTGI